MNETWEQTKQRLKQQGISTTVEIIEPPKPRYDEAAPEPPVKRYNIHKRSLPVGIDKIVVFSVTKPEALWWIEHRLKTKIYEEELDDSKTLIYYDILSVDATPKEKSPYYNSRPFIVE